MKELPCSNNFLVLLNKLNNPTDDELISRLKQADLSQEEALEYLASINYGPMPGLTDEQVRTFFSIAYPGEELEIDHIHHEGWFDDDSVSDDEKAAYVNQLLEKFQ